jgi:Na+/proline symporter
VEADTMPLALTSLDYMVLGLYLSAMIGVGLYFSREQRTSRDFFLAGRSMAWFPVGLSIMATLVSVLSYSGIPGESYFVGYKFLVLPLAIWCTLPLMSWAIIPLYHRLGIFTIYEYLELRFDATTRWVSSVIFVIWRLLWLGGVLYAPCKMLIVAGGLQVDIWWMLLILGTVSTLYTFLGGMKAVIWTDVMQATVMGAGLILIVVCVWLQLEGGPARVAEIARELGRAEFVETGFDWSRKWSVWGIAPHFFLSMLSFFAADQITAQRFLTARNVLQAKRSFTLNCVSVSFMIPALMYTGVCLLAFYHEHPESLRPIWVANVDPRTRGSATGPDGTPLIAWEHHAITPANIDQLARDGRLLRPNTLDPFTSADDLVIADHEGARIDVRKLAMRRPPGDGARQGEVILHHRAQDELLPHFITSRLAAGLAGLILAALLAASMSSMDSGLNAICTLLVTDFHRRLGIGRHALARRLNKRVEDLNEEDELRIGRPLVLGIGLAATVFSLGVARIDNIFTIMVGVVNTFGGPLLAVFLLGIFTRRTTSRAALITLAAGTLLTVWLMVANHYDAMSWLWPWSTKLDGVWPLTIGVVFSLACGYLASFLVGRRKSPSELRGLVAGLGQLGVREPEEAFLAMPESFEANESA